MDMSTTLDLSTLESLVTANNDLLAHIYSAQLFLIGCGGALLVIVLLYRFLKKFY